MTGAEYLAVLDRFDLTHIEAAAFLGVNEKTSRRWGLDEHAIPASVEMLLLVMVSYGFTPESVTALVQEKRQAA
jgi:hypothetical protein